MNKSSGPATEFDGQIRTWHPVRLKANSLRLVHKVSSTNPTTKQPEDYFDGQGTYQGAKLTMTSSSLSHTPYGFFYRRRSLGGNQGSWNDRYDSKYPERKDYYDGNLYLAGKGYQLPSNIMYLSVQGAGVFTAGKVVLDIKSDQPDMKGFVCNDGNENRIVVEHQVPSLLSECY